MPPEFLAHVSPLGWEHINLTGEYRWPGTDSTGRAKRLGHWRQLTCYLLGFVVYFGCMQRNVELEATIVAKYAVVSPVLDERSRRRWAATESLFIGYGGDALVSSATGLARETIRKGRREISQGQTPTDRVRRPGAGRAPVSNRASPVCWPHSKRWWTR